MPKKKQNICKNCLYWINCTPKSNKPHGFCLLEPLFTYTEKSKCEDYFEDKTLLEKVKSS